MSQHDALYIAKFQPRGKPRKKKKFRPRDMKGWDRFDPSFQRYLIRAFKNRNK